MTHAAAQPQPTPSSVTAPTPYRAPAVRDLGPWKAVTLIYSVPGGPGGRTGQF